MADTFSFKFTGDDMDDSEDESIRLSGVDTEAEVENHKPSAVDVQKHDVKELVRT